MTSKSFEWDMATKQFKEVDDPTAHVEADTVAASIYGAGYRQEFSSEDEDGVGGTVAIYQCHEPEKPRFYIFIMGQDTGIATLVARDFPSLVATLQQIHPLLTLAGLDQFAAAQCVTRVQAGN